MLRGLRSLFGVVGLIVTSTMLVSCGAIVKSKANTYITEEKGAIPPDFGKQNSTVLFVTHHRSYNKYLKKNVKNIYKGNYKFVTEDELENDTEYQDITTYRYVFDYNYVSAGHTTTTNTVQSGDFSTTTTRLRPALYNVKKFMVLDRKTQKTYYCKMTSSYWSKLQKVYLKKLNEKRLEE
ncbi:hypothetical protein [Tenacibaculum sp.]|uniref:hypothetical protein n=1 Tax=Tenacibaculum sp. TaxID=1906242 RepID=UPI003D118340